MFQGLGSSFALLTSPDSFSCLETLVQRHLDTWRPTLSISAPQAQCRRQSHSLPSREIPLLVTGKHFFPRIEITWEEWMWDWSKVRPIGWTPIVLVVPPCGPDLASSLGTQAAMLAAPSGSTDRIHDPTPAQKPLDLLPLLSLFFSCSVMSDSATPWTTAHQASLPFTISRNLLKLMSIGSVVAIQPISSSVTPFSCLQSFPASGSFPISRLFASGGQRLGLQLQHQSFQ